MRFRSGAMAFTIAAALAVPAASAQTPDEAALAAALTHGGYVIVMRHAHAPEQPPGAAEADRSNAQLERQLDAAGRAAAKAMGDAMRALHLPVGAVWSSPTYRARETVQVAGLPAPRIAAELGDNGRSMQGTNGDQAAWLRARANEQPRPGTDTVIVTQFPNISGAFGDAAAGMKDGEALVFRPAAGTGPRLMGRIAIEQWPALAGRAKHKERSHGA
jgi:hypothetical protein